MSVKEHVQVPVSVLGCGASSVIARALQSPTLLVMRIQGAEPEIVKGSGEYLECVTALQIELSLRRVYTR